LRGGEVTATGRTDGQDCDAVLLSRFCVGEGDAGELAALIDCDLFESEFQFARVHGDVEEVGDSRTTNETDDALAAKCIGKDDPIRSSTFEFSL
jgi:hypothetical protein